MTKHHSRYQLRCCRCGRFVPCTADQGAYYGRPTALDPPLPVYFCESCAQHNYDRAIALGRVIRCWWIPPQWAVDARAILTSPKRQET